MSTKLISKACERNKGPILEVLQKILPDKFPGNSKLSVLELASGSGQHAVYFPKELPNLSWQPTDIDAPSLDSIKAYVEDSSLPNVKLPLFLDISQKPSMWFKPGSPPFDIMFAINLIHISPWSCTEGLFRTAAVCLQSKGVLITYGAYAVDGIITPESNVSFNQMLQAANSEWGVRDLRKVEEEAKRNGIVLDAMFDMPSNNKLLVWARQ